MIATREENGSSTECIWEHSVDGPQAPSIRRQREIDEAEKKVEMVEQLMTPMDLDGFGSQNSQMVVS